MSAVYRMDSMSAVYRTDLMSTVYRTDSTSVAERVASIIADTTSDAQARTHIRYPKKHIKVGSRFWKLTSISHTYSMTAIEAATFDAEENARSIVMEAEAKALAIVCEAEERAKAIARGAETVAKILIRKAKDRASATTLIGQNTRGVCAEEPDADFEVDRIVACKRTANGLEFLIQWKGFPNEDTWEPLENLWNCRDYLAAFLAEKYMI
jgi:hypothetical protein